MKYLIIDDEAPAVAKIKFYLNQLTDNAEINSFNTAAGFSDCAGSDYNYAFIDEKCYNNELANEIVQKSPECKIIMIIGFADSELKKNQQFGKVFLKKPFTLNTLGQAISS